MRIVRHGRRFFSTGTAKEKLWVFSHAACQGHDVPGHPECAARFPSVLRALEASKLPLHFVSDSPPARRGQLLLFHTADHVRMLDGVFEQVEKEGVPLVQIDPDTGEQDSC